MENLMDLQVTFYTRKECKLCDDAKADLDALQSEIPHTLTVVDIDEDDDLTALYGHKIPVITAGPFTLAAPFDKRKLRMTLGAARDSHSQKLETQGDKYTRKQERLNRLSTGDRLSHFISGNYLKIINILLLIYFGLPFLAPVLMQAGLPGAARPIYTVYRCGWLSHLWPGDRPG
jgi:hypothetical protein